MAEDGPAQGRGDVLHNLISAHSSDSVHTMCNGNGSVEHLHIKEEINSYGSDDSPNSPLDFSFKRRNGESEASEVDSYSPASTQGTGSGGHADDNKYPYFERSVSPRNGNDRPSLDKIGEPKLASDRTIPPGLASMLHAFQSGTLPPSAAASMISALPSVASFMEPRLAQANKTARPFKAYPKEPLSMPVGCFGVSGFNPFQTVDASMLHNLNEMNSEELLNMYKHQLHLMQEHASSTRQPARSTESSSASATSSSTGISSSISSSTNNNHNHHHYVNRHRNNSSPSSIPSPGIGSPGIGRMPSQAIPGTSGISPQHGMNRKRPRSLPDNQKDEAYWERRRKNNEAAKRSRDARRAKEDEIAIRAALLEQENMKLRVEVAALKTETAKLRCMLYNSWFILFSWLYLLSVFSMDLLYQVLCIFRNFTQRIGWKCYIDFEKALDSGI